MVVRPDAGHPRKQASVERLDEHVAADRKSTDLLATAIRAFERVRLNEHHYKPTTLVEYGRTLERLERSLGERRCCDLAPDHVQGFLASVPPGSLRSVYSTVAAVLRWLDAHGYPGLAELVPARKPAQRRRTRYLTDAEYRRLWAGLHDEGIIRGTWPTTVAALRFAVLVPLRRGELVSLAWHEVDVPGRRLFLEDTKTGDRVLPLGRAACSLLVAQRNDHHYVFPGKQGLGHISATSLNHAFSRLLERIGINKPSTPRNRRVSMHTLRHAWASQRVRAGVSLEKVRRILGHGTAYMSARYAHVGADEVRDVVDGFEADVARCYQLGLPLPVEGGSR